MILLGGYTDIVQLELAPRAENGVLRYINAFEFLPGPPIPALLTILVVLGFNFLGDGLRDAADPYSK